MMLSVDFPHESVSFTVVPKVKIYEGMRHHMEKNKETTIRKFSLFYWKSAKEIILSNN